jgi:hypothetical protein
MPERSFIQYHTAKHFNQTVGAGYWEPPHQPGSFPGFKHLINIKMPFVKEHL